MLCSSTIVEMHECKNQDGGVRTGAVRAGSMEIEYHYCPLTLSMAFSQLRFLVGMGQRNVVDESLEGLCKTLVAARDSGILCTFLSSSEERDLVSSLCLLAVAVFSLIVNMFRPTAAKRVSARNLARMAHGCAIWIAYCLHHGLRRGSYRSPRSTRIPHGKHRPHP